MNKVTELHPVKKVLFTHTDMDGVGCAVLLSKAFPDIEIYFIDYAEVNEVIGDYLINHRTNDYEIWITDMSVDADMAEILNSRGKVNLIDHHATAKWLQEKYNWAYVDVSYSATMHVYNLLSTIIELGDYKAFAELVDNYDTWGYGTHPTDEAQSLNKLLQVMGKYRWLNRFNKVSSVKMSTVENVLIELDIEKEQKYIQDSVRVAVTMTDPQGYTYALLSADQYISQVGNYLIDNYPQLEYVILLDMRLNKASLRGRGNVDLGKMAKLLGGGGHKRAAGFPMDNPAYKLYLIGPSPVGERLVSE